MEEKLTLKSVQVIFSNMVDEGFGRSITIDATDPEVQKQITEWVKANNIGKGENAGKAKFKEYEGKKQYSIKISDYTKFGYTGDLTLNDLGYGATISLTALAFDYDNKFGKGTSSNLSAVLVEGRAKTSADDDLAELVGETGDEVPLEARADVEPTDIDDNEPVDFSKIPF